MPAEVFGEIKMVKTYRYATGDKLASVAVEFALKGHEEMVGELVKMHADEKMVVAIFMDSEEHDRFISKSEKK